MKKKGESVDEVRATATKRRRRRRREHSTQQNAVGTRVTAAIKSYELVDLDISLPSQRAEERSRL
jgi:hypothetical protein